MPPRSVTTALAGFCSPMPRSTGSRRLRTTRPFPMGSPMARSGIAQRNGSVGRPGVAAQDGHEQFVVPLALPAESMPQASLKSEAALLVDPLGARIEVVDPKAHPVQTARAQRVVDN